MSPKSTHAWHTTEDDLPIPVKIIAEEHVRTPAGAHVLHAEMMPTVQKPSLILPAIIGMAVVLAGLGWYFDLGDVLLGQLEGETAKTVTITAEGHFDPKELDLLPGESVTIRNEHIDPQVLKPQGNRTLFDVQVLFEDPITLTVPSDAAGPYTYFSETLPEDRTITFHVALPETVAETSTIDTPATVISDDLPIPIPFGMDVVKNNDPPPAPKTDALITTQESGPATITLGESDKSEALKTQKKTVAVKIPTNPFTVGATGADQMRAGALAAAQGEQLHSGAPLAQYADYRPPVTSSTGPEHTAVVVMLLSGLLFAPLARRMLRI